VAKNEIFRTFVKDVTLQIAAAHPLFVSRNEVPEDMIAKEKEVASAQIKGKPENVIEKIVRGKLDKFFSSVCLMEQAFVKEDKKTMEEMVKLKIVELGENIVIRRFVRFAVGEEI